MLPMSSFSGIMFPMTAEVFYPYENQNDIGQIEHTWSYDRTITCSAIKDRPSSRIGNAVISMKFIEIDFVLDFRTPDDITMSSTDEHQPMNDILVTNIQDPAGNYPWIEPSGRPTVFEVQNIEPLYDAFHTVFAYRIRMRRADDQVVLNG